MNVIDEIDDEVARYFRSIGFTVTWDRSTREMAHWYQILEDGVLLAQIDFGATVASLKEDLPLLAQNKEGTSNGDWYICCEKDQHLVRIVERMRMHDDPVGMLSDILRANNIRPTFDPERSIAKPCMICGTTDKPRDLVAIGTWLRAIGGHSIGDLISRPMCSDCDQLTKPAAT